jgi:hypothetical protein
LLSGTPIAKVNKTYDVDVTGVEVVQAVHQQRRGKGHEAERAGVSELAVLTESKGQSRPYRWKNPDVLGGERALSVIRVRALKLGSIVLGERAEKAASRTCSWGVGSLATRATRSGRGLVNCLGLLLEIGHYDYKN